MALLLFAVLIPVALPFVHRDFPQGHDATAHLSNLFRFNRALSQGQWPVRWVEGMRLGQGQPLFNFYQVGFYYVVETVHATGLPLSVAYKMAPVLLWWLGSLFMFLLVRPYGLLPAAAGTITFALSPYLIVDVFVPFVAEDAGCDRCGRSGREGGDARIPPKAQLAFGS